MTAAKTRRLSIPGDSPTTVAGLVPLWLFLLAIMAEGFPHPPLSPAAAGVAFVVGLGISLALLIRQRLPIELLLYSLTPFLLLYGFDEISTSYKSPFIVACGILLTLGLATYQVGPANRLTRGLLLLGTVAIVLLLAQHAAFNFWEMANHLGYVQCFPDAHGCPPLTGHETPWWRLFFGQ